MLIPVSLIIPTINRRAILVKALQTVALQGYQPREIIIIDASKDNRTKNILNIDGLKSNITYLNTTIVGAAAQRNQGIASAKQPVIGFMDDDIYLEPDCFEIMWNGLLMSEDIGGVNAMIVNQKYQPPRFISSVFYALMNGKPLKSYAGKCIGPGINFHPSDDENLPKYCEVEWLNTGCTFYKKEALPDPVFEEYFNGYSFMEDLTLSVKIAKKWKLINARTAKVFHDSQKGVHKDNIRELSKMDFVNRYHLMVSILNKSSIKDRAKLYSLQLFNIMSSMVSTKRDSLFQIILGKLDAIIVIKKMRST